MTETETKRTYEALYIVDPNSSDEQIDSVIAKYQKVVTDNGGEVLVAGKWDKRKLTYEIKGHKEGVYILMYFTGETSTESEVQRIMRISDDCLKHMILRVDPQHVDTTRIVPPAKEEPRDDDRRDRGYRQRSEQRQEPRQEPRQEAPAEPAAPEAKPQEEAVAEEAKEAAPEAGPAAEETPAAAEAGPAAEETPAAPDTEEKTE